MIPTPIDCAATVAPAKLTAFQVSFDTAGEHTEKSIPRAVHSVPEKEPDPYDTLTEWPVEVQSVNLVPAPTHKFAEPVSTISENYNLC